MAERTRVKTRFGTVTATPQQAEYFRRIEKFGPPSKLASVDEKQAYEAYQLIPEIQSGRATMADLPEQYGGRPIGESRRAIRMREEYDKQQADLLNQQRIMQQMEINQKELALREQEQQSIMESRNIARDAAVAKAGRDAKVKEQATGFMQSVIGATLPDGTRTRPINVNDDDAVERLQRAMYMNPFGMEDQYAKETAIMMLDDAMRIREQRTGEVAAQNKAAIINKAYAEGLTEKEIEGTKFADPNTGIADFNYAEIERLTAQKTGERKTKEPEEEVYKPISVTEARDRRDVVQAEFDTLSASVEKGELEDDDPDYVKTRARLRRAEAELKIAERTKQPQVGGAQTKKENSNIQNTLEKFEEVDKRIGPLFLERMKRLGVDSVDEGTVNTVLNITGLKDRGELASALRDQSALDWANANPEDPRSPQIKQRLGVE